MYVRNLAAIAEGRSLKTDSTYVAGRERVAVFGRRRVVVAACTYFVLPADSVLALVYRLEGDTPQHPAQEADLYSMRENRDALLACLSGGCFFALATSGGAAAMFNSSNKSA
jgi:hypothetical protein